MVHLTIYSRPGCHLCDEMKTLVERVGRSERFSLEEVDISGDAELERQYGLEIPVLMVNGRKAAKYRIAEAALRRILSDAVETPEESGGTAPGSPPTSL
jgi:glutaredoxin